MLKNYLKIAIRTIRRQKAYSFINIAGLTLGLVLSIVIAFYVIDDITFDTFHEDADNIHRVLTIENTKFSSMIYSITSGPLVSESKETIPEVLHSVRAFGMGTPFVAAGDIPRNELTEDNALRLRGYITEPSFFDVFSFKLLEGDKENALITPNGILITPSAAERLFPNEDPIGQRLSIQFMGPGNGNGQQDPFVIGLVEEPPTNSHIRYDFIIPLQTQNFAVWFESWENFMLQGYVKLTDGANAAEVEEKMLRLSRANNMPEINMPKLQPLLDVHLGSADHRYDGTNLGKNDRTVVYSLGVIGFLIILVASINFINLSSARALKRAREVGMRKVVGSNKSMLIMQFLGESIFLTLISLVFALIIIQFTAPYIEEFLGKILNINFIENPLILIGITAVAIVIGILSGLYPAFLLSSFQPVTVLKGSFQKSTIGALLRQVLVLFQFAVAISLAVVVLTIHQQIEYLKTIDMGYNRDQVITMFAPNNGDDVLINRLKNITGVQSVGRSNAVVAGNLMRVEVVPEGGSREDNSFMMQQMTIDDSFLNTLEVSMQKGRQFAGGFTADTNNSILLNETAAKTLGWSEDALNKRLGLVTFDGTIDYREVVGIVKDFHLSNARQKMEPIYFTINTGNTFIVSAKIAGGQIQETIAEIETAYKEVYPERNFNYMFLDDVFDQQFRNDREFAANISYFSIVAIFIACLGLLGLVSYAVEQKKGEIAIRKVLGSNEGTIVYILAKDFLKWVLIANLIAWPLGYYGIGLWLDGFVYRTSVSIFPFITSGFGALLIAFLTLLYQAIRASRTNPVEVLRNQ